MKIKRTHELMMRRMEIKNMKIKLISLILILCCFVSVPSYALQKVNISNLTDEERQKIYDLYDEWEENHPRLVNIVRAAYNIKNTIRRIRDEVVRPLAISLRLWLSVSITK